MLIYRVIRRWLFAMDAETAHRAVFRAVAGLGRVPGADTLLRGVYGYEHPRLQQELWGRTLVNPVGLAAGFDKDGLLLGPLLNLGFGMVEAGTVTPAAQAGNALPRLFRLVEDEALINRMGFNNLGSAHLQMTLLNLSRKGTKGWVGANLGKNLTTSLEQAHEDYMLGFQRMYSLADYLVINLSSPNTPGLRSLQARAAMEAVIAPMVRERTRLMNSGAPKVPLLVKVSPDLEEDALAGIVTVVNEQGLDGIVATNTTLARRTLRSPNASQSGGLSGRPLRDKSLEMVRELYRLTAGKVPIIGVGGIFDAQDAYRFIGAGACVVQLYSGLIFRGPSLVRHIKKGLVRLLEHDGFATLAEAVGKDHKIARQVAKN